MSSKIVRIKLHPDSQSVQVIIQVIYQFNNNDSSFIIAIFLFQKPSDLFCSSIQRSPDLRVKMVVELCSSEDNPAMVYDVLEDTSAVTATFRGLREDLEYILKVSILVNGKIVSSVSKEIKDVERNETQLITEPDFLEELSSDSEQLMDTTPLLLV